jgi:hypothetical protein
MTTTTASLLKYGGQPFSDMNSHDDGLYFTERFSPIEHLEIQ